MTGILFCLHEVLVKMGLGFFYDKFFGGFLEVYCSIWEMGGGLPRCAGVGVVFCLLIVEWEM